MRTARVIALLVVAGALAAPASAQAGPGTDVALCTFSGATSAMTNIPGSVASQSQTHGDAEDDALSAIPGNQAGETGVIIETGSYFFGTALPFLAISTQCRHIDGDGALDGRDDTGIYPAGITSNGTYQSILCGTGVMEGSATLSLTGDAEIPSIQFNYVIGYHGTSTSEGNTLVPSPTSMGSHSAFGQGTVDIDWGFPTGCVTSDSEDFGIRGFFVFVSTS